MATNFFAGMAAVVAAMAAAAEPKTWQWHGFAAQGAFHSTDNAVYGDSDDGLTLGFTELGLNGQWTPAPAWRLSGQVVSRRAGELSDGSPRIDYASVDWRFASASSFRVGRVKNPLGLYNETRDVAFTRPGILLPQSIYTDAARDLALSSDGGQLHSRLPMAGGELQLTAGAGVPVFNDETVQALVGNILPGRLDGNQLLSGQLRFEHLADGWVVAYSYLDAELDYRPGAMDLFGQGQLAVRHHLWSLQYNMEWLSLTAEYLRSRYRWQHFSAPLPLAEAESEAYYLQAEYYFTPSLSLLLRWDKAFSNRDDRDGQAMAAATGWPAHRAFAEDYTLGLRYDWSPQWMARLEYHYVDGTGWLSLVDNPDLAQLDRHWQLVGLEVAYRF